MEKLSKVSTFFSNMVEESNKITWPEKGELLESTGVVLFSVAVLSIIVGISDLIIIKIVKWILSLV
jgi:preprotein translocase SecE subunit